MKNSFDIWVVQLAYQVINFITTVEGILKVTTSTLFYQTFLTVIVCF